MEQAKFFLRTKLLPPRAGSGLLERPRLTERLRANTGAPVTLVAADAGCGKTTLIADFLRDGTYPSVWYQLDHTDADPIVFLNYIAQGIKSIQPDFGDALLSYLSEASEDLVRFPERAGDLLINEILRSIERPFILVLDDYHHIGTDTIVHKIVDRILQYSSEHLHLIITTRDLPTLAIMRRRSQSAALVITRDDLLFTDTEVRELFRKTLSIELNDEQIAEYRERTHGWITALQLVRQIAEKEIDGEGSAQQLDLTDILQRSEKDIFDYFAEEVFAREDAETQKLLLYVSLLKSLPLEHCSLLFPEMRCSAALPELAQKNIFLTVAGDGGASEEYRFHPLFHDFLQRRLRSEIGQVRVSEERNRIAETFLANKQWEMALPFLLDAENFERAAEVIADRGNEWIAAGAIISLGQFAELVPVVVLEKFPRSLLHKAEIARLQGETDKSTSLLHRAVKLFQEQNDAVGEAEALHSLASLTRRKGKPHEALDLLEKAEMLVPQDSETYIKCLNTRGLCLILEGNWTEAEQQFRIALELAEAQSNDRYLRLIAHNLALAPGFRGDFGEALRWFNRIFRDDKPDKQLPQEAIGHLNVARLHLFRGEFDETETHLERALELCQLFNLRSLLPEIFETYANFYREKQDFQHASEFYERSLNAYDEAGVDLATRELNEERAKFSLLRGDTAKARGLLETLVASRLRLNGELTSNTAHLCLCRVDLAEGKTDGLGERVQSLIDFFHGQNYYYDEALASMLLAEVYFNLDKKKEMVAPIQRVLDLSARFDYEYWLKNEIRRNRSIFAYEDILEKLPPDLREIVESHESRVESASLSTLASPLAPFPITDLTIKVLGHAEIYRDQSKPFAPDAWTTRRARDIFCYIATRKHRRVPKDVLIEAFWGNEEFDAIEKNFHPTISHIRKALNSRQALKQNFIVFRDGAYQLNPEFSYSIDTEDFIEFIAAAETAKRDKNNEELRKNLESAYDLYRGDFMEGLYEDWAEEQRPFYQDQFSRVLNALAKLSVSEKRWTDALKFAGQILTIDPYREDLHRLTMKVLAAQGKPAAVKKHYEDMKELLKQDLGIEAAEETRRLVNDLLK
jgi:ATP/maltotriose-dependent transcriptional regulator MalT/DNA-binding SARP family transcriptional activator